MANPPVFNELGKVCGNCPGGAGRRICCGTPPLLGQPRSVVGMVCISVKRGEHAAVSIPAGLLRPVDRPNEPAESNVFSRPEPLRSYTIVAPARITVLSPPPKIDFSKPELGRGDQAYARPGPKAFLFHL